MNPTSVDTSDAPIKKRMNQGKIFLNENDEPFAPIDFALCVL